MAVTDTVEIEFLAKDEVTKILQKIEKNTQDLSKTVEKSGSKTEKSFLDINKVAETALGFGVGSVLTNLTGQVKQFAAQSIKDFMTLERQMQGLEVQTGHTADVLLNELSVATDGLVDKLSLAQGAARALALGLKQDMLPDLARTAVALGKIQGLRPEQAFNDLVTGIGRASPMILDNLGIVLDAEEAYKKWANTNNRTVESMSKLEKTTALTTAVIEKSKYVTLAMEMQMNTMADTADKARAAIKDFGVILGEALLSPIQLAILLGTSEGLASITDEFKAAQGAANIYSDEIIRLNEEQKSFTNSLKESISLLDELMKGGQTKEQEDIQNEINKKKLKELELQKAIQEASGIVTRTSDGGFTVSGSNQALKAQSEKELKTVLEERKKLELDLSILQADQKVKLDEIEPQVEKITGHYDTIAASNSDLLLKLQDELVNYNSIGLAIEENEKQITLLGERLQSVKDIQDGIVEKVKEEANLRRQMMYEARGTVLGATNRRNTPISDEAG